MKLNQNTQIVGENVTLVPYCRDHVPKYHSWMQDEELRDATGSDLLTLNEEYAMQENWREDENKCTFIVTDKTVLQKTNEEVQAMLGDVNLFVSNDDEGKKIAEVSIMIAEKFGRGQGKGFEALCHMLNYGAQSLIVDKFEAKIKIGNIASVRLFEKAGFQLVDTCEIFQETTYAVDVTQEWKNWLAEATKNANIIHYSSYFLTELIEVGL